MSPVIGEVKKAMRKFLHHNKRGQSSAWQRREPDTHQIQLDMVERAPCLALV